MMEHLEEFVSLIFVDYAVKMQPNQPKNFLLWILLTYSITSQYLVKVDAARATSSSPLQTQTLYVSKISPFRSKGVNGHQQPQTTQTLTSLAPKQPPKDTEVVSATIDGTGIPDIKHESEFRTVKLFDSSESMKQTPSDFRSFSQTSTQQAPFPDDSRQSIKIVQSTPENNIQNINPQKPEEPPQVEAQPNEPAAPTPTQIEQRLEKPDTDYSQRLERLLRLLEKTKQPAPNSSNGELGSIIAKPQTSEPQTSEIGTIIARPAQIEQPPLPTQPPTVEKNPVLAPEPIGYLLGRVSYFQTNNLFASKVDPIEDGLIYSGVTLASAPFKLGSKTFLSGSLDANIIRYVSQSEFNYNQLRFNVDLYHQITRRMYGEIGWSNQQLFYAKDSSRFGFASGDRFLNENSFHLSLGRRDPLTKKLMLDSFYDLRWSLAEVPQKRDRITNSLWLSLSYYLQQSLNVGLDYQLTFSDFTQRSREDLYHRLFTHLNYKATDTSSISFQAGVTLGDSTERNISFDGWFFSINYNWEIGRF